MKNTIIVIAAIATLLFSACAGEAKHKAFNEKDALEFLYEYMPLGDSVDYTED